ncbi:MAG: hypothetical protein MZV64_48685 [Ignavibacteriales bacterium]|nr:hypothetical protein [Ignavibacteriales bacterium]
MQLFATDRRGHARDRRRRRSASTPRMLDAAPGFGVRGLIERRAVPRRLGRGIDLAPGRGTTVMLSIPLRALARPPRRPAISRRSRDQLEGGDGRSRSSSSMTTRSFAAASCRSSPSTREVQIVAEALDYATAARRADASTARPTCW